MQGRDTAPASEFLPGTVISANGDGTYDVQWDSGGEPARLPAAHLRRVYRGTTPGTPRAAADLLGSGLEEDYCKIHVQLSQSLLERREEFLNALFPALLAAHERKSSVHQMFLSVLVTAMEKFGALLSSVSTTSTISPAPVIIHVLTEDITRIDSCTFQSPPSSFGSVMVDPSMAKRAGKW